MFRNEDNYFYFLKKYGACIPPIAETFAYCLLPNHLHLMVRIRDEETVLKFLHKRKPALKIDSPNLLHREISLQFSHLFNGYAQGFNRVHGRRGGLFVANFERKPVDSPQYFKRLMAYIHLNPVHHGIVSNLNDWRHSSWHSYQSSRPSKLTREEAFGWFGSKQRFYQLHEELKSQDIWKEFDF